MKRKLLILFSMFMLFFILVVSNVFASSPLVIGDGKAVGYEYTITKEQDTFTWKIGHQGNISVIEEGTENKHNLNNFMHAVGDSKVQLVQLILSVSYFFIVAITTLFFYKKNKKMLKGGGVIIAALAGIALYIAVATSIDLTSSLGDAKFYYFKLTS